MYMHVCVWLFGLLIGFYGIPTIAGYIMPNPFLFTRNALYQTIQLSIIHFSSIWYLDRTLSSATTPGQSELGSGGYKKLLLIS